MIFKSITELLRYRALVRHLATLDLKLRYRGSVFGFLWTLLNPLLLMLVLWAVFSRFGRIQEKNYALFLLSALMTWTFFQQTVNSSLTSIIRQKGLISKIYIPKLVFPVALSLSNLVNLGFFLIAYFMISVVTPVGIPVTAVLVVPLFLMLVLMTLGLSLVMATLNVFFRDFSHMTDIVLRALFYLTPVIYPPDMLGPRAAELLKLNPVYYPVVAGRDLLYYGNWPELETWLIGFSVAFALLFLGLLIFTRAQNKFVYYA